MSFFGNYLPICAFFGFSARLIIQGANLGDAIALFGFAALYGFGLYLQAQKEEPINNQIKAELEALRNQVSSIQSSNTLNKAKATLRY